MLQSGPAWCRTAPIPFTEFARETRRLAWRERARNVLSQGRRRARNIGAPPPAPTGTPRRGKPERARARPCPLPYFPPRPPPNLRPRARRRPRSALPIGAEQMEERETAFQLNRPIIGLSSSLVATLVLLFAFAARRLLLSRCFRSSTWRFQLESPTFSSILDLPYPANLF